MKYNYTAIIVSNKNDKKFYCRVPDLPGCIMTGHSLDNAIEMITDAASGWLVVAEDEGNKIPEPTAQADMDIPENAYCTILRVDTIAYRAATDTKAVRKNVLLPAWMAHLAEKRNINCSQVLQDRLMQILDKITPIEKI